MKACPGIEERKTKVGTGTKIKKSLILDPKVSNLIINRKKLGLGPFLWLKFNP
jgi:hypothetical protein